MLLYKVKKALSLKYTVITYYIFFQYILDKIEQKIDVKANIAWKIIQKAIIQIDCDNFYEVLACIRDGNWPKRDIQVINNTELSKNISKAMLDYHNLQPYITILD